MKILLFGATGTAGGSVLRACLADPAVEEVRAVVRRPLSLEHEKIRVFIHKDFQDYTGVEAVFAGWTRACSAWGSRSPRFPARRSTGGPAPEAGGRHDGAQAGEGSRVMGWDTKRYYPVAVSKTVTVQATADQKARWKAAAYRKGLGTPGAFLAWVADVFLEMEEAYKKQVDRHLNECNPPSRSHL